VQALVQDAPWTLMGELLARVETDASGDEILRVDERVLRRLQEEEQRRTENRALIAELKAKDAALAHDPILMRWRVESQPLPQPWPKVGEYLPVWRVMGDPAWAKEMIAFAKTHRIHFEGDAYGYSRAFATQQEHLPTGMVVLDPTAGGGSIPFEALRLGHTVIANDINPVATVILHATLNYPAQFGPELVKEIQEWGNRLLAITQKSLTEFYPDRQALPREEQHTLQTSIVSCPELFLEFNLEQSLDYIYARQVTCPHCGGEAPLLNTCWLSKEAEDQWGVRIVTDGKPRCGTVSFETYRVVRGRGPNGEDPEQATVNRGIGQCVHCRQAIPGEEIKAQARGESPHGRWTDRLYCVVAVRLEPRWDRNGKPQRYASGPNRGEIKTRKVRFFRPPNERDLQALKEAEARLQERWPVWEAAGLIPTERLPDGQKTSEPLRYGMSHWCDLFTPRQFLGHLTLVEGLNRLKPKILAALGPERGRAVVTYLQCAIDKGLDYNSRQTLWHSNRGVIAHTFTRHDYSLKWTFGEMIFTGPNSGAAWGLTQVIDAYRGIAELVKPLHDRCARGTSLPLTILNGTAAYMPGIPDQSVDLVCMDPPYYDNVQYGELSDYFYVWQRRTLSDLYPDPFTRRLVNKSDEAVANPARDGSSQAAKAQYERMMQEIFNECLRVLKHDGLMTLMFTHKTQDAWEALTRSLIEAGWTITASFPVESESTRDIHHKDIAAAASSIFLSCRKRTVAQPFPAVWTGLGGQGVQHRIRAAVQQGLLEFKLLNLTPVDEMVACYGRALHVLSEQWPVMDGDEPVGPLRAMNEASRVVAEHQITRVTDGRLSVDDLDPETAMALTLYGIWGLYEFAYDEALNLSRSLHITLSARPAGYRIEGRMIGINQEAEGRRGRSRGAEAEDLGYHAPLVRKGSKLRLARPEERNARRLEHPQTDWDILHGVIQAYRTGDIPVARAYLARHAPQHTRRIMDLLDVWATEMDDPDLRREAQTMHFGLRPLAG
jgi:putative DNA methylase